VVAKLATDILGKNVLVVTINSESYPDDELKHAKKLANHLGFRHLIVEHSELNNRNIVSNPVDRCYYCRKDMIKVLRQIASEKDIQTIADGVTISDFREHRPGIKASTEEGIWHPLVEAGLSKSDVRSIAKRLNLPNYDKPSMACLFSRIPYGEIITLEKLTRIENAERFLREHGFSQVRVRCHNDTARIEVLKNELIWFFNTKNREKVVRKLKHLGFVYVTVDLVGYRSGSMDEVLKTK
jgi:uncharacterized protein